MTIVRWIGGTPSAPGAMRPTKTSDGSPDGRFQRALKMGNVNLALASAPRDQACSPMGYSLGRSRSRPSPLRRGVMAAQVKTRGSAAIVGRFAQRSVLATSRQRAARLPSRCAPPGSIFGEHASEDRRHPSEDDDCANRQCRADHQWHDPGRLTKSDGELPASGRY